ncbi:hypothetical protein EV641_12831 [Rhodococcus sp. SMB37]|nr:hypothetical protein EV641_12831 [Rhodococcus sp. SMB37]
MPQVATPAEDHSDSATDLRCRLVPSPVASGFAQFQRERVGHVDRTVATVGVDVLRRPFRDRRTVGSGAARRPPGSVVGGTISFIPP